MSFLCNGIYFKSVPVYTLPDNLDVDPTTGDIWTATSPVPWMVFEHMADLRKPSPSQVHNDYTL